MMMRRIAGLLAVALMASVSPTMVQARADEPIKILLIGKERDHPPRTHEYMAECRLLAKCLEQTPGISAVVSDGWPKQQAALEGIDVIVLYTAVGGDLLFADPERRKQVEDLLNKGVGLVAIHWSTDASPGEAGEKQLEYLGGWFHRPPSEIPVVDSVVRQADPSHPVSRGWADFPMKDEYYIKLRFNDAVQPILRAQVNGTDYIVGWALERPGGGRSFATVCGHFHECFTMEPFRKAVVNGVLWAAGAQVPEGGAPVAVTTEDLALPPDPREAK